MQVELTKTLKKVGEKTFTNFYITLPSGTRVAIKQAFAEHKADFFLLKEYATLYRPEEEEKH